MTVTMSFGRSLASGRVCNGLFVQQLRQDLKGIAGVLSRRRLLTTSKDAHDEVQESATVVFNNVVVRRYVESLVEEHRRIAHQTATSSSNERIVYLKPIVDCFFSIQSKQKELVELTNIINDRTSDAEMQMLAQEDRRLCCNSLLSLEEKLVELLTSAEAFDTGDNDIVVEVTAGVGGQEAMLFAKELFDMYECYVRWKGWDVQSLQCQLTELDGLRHGNICVSGKGAYEHLKFEGGVHRVQRIPKTERSGRVHTSTVAVAVLPRPSTPNVSINPKELKIETKRATGAGGQHVNKTDSAVRITHLPTGFVVECQEERSQLVNKATAMRKLAEKLFRIQYEEQLNTRQSSRKIQVGTSGRSEKIRTYNFVQDRVTDHRIAVTVHNLPGFFTGSEGLDHMSKLLRRESQREILLEVIEKYNKNNT